MTIQFTTRKIVKSLVLIAALLVLIHVVSLVLIKQNVNQLTEVLVEKFSLEGEGNFPSYFSAFILFFAAGLFGVIGKGARMQHKSTWKYWTGLSGIFVFLSLDEAVQLHEKLDTDLIWASFETTGLLAWPWVILYGGLAAIVGGIYFRFWLGLPAKFRFAFAVAAAVYVFSALGFEMLEALEYTTNGGVTTRFIFLTSVEEILEMSAIIYLISTNFKYISESFPDLKISFETPSSL